MSGLQRDHTVNSNWTNNEGYNDGTAGAAMNNIMRQQAKPPKPVLHKKPVTQDGETTYIQVEHKPKAKPAAQRPKQKTPDEQALRMARTVYTVVQMICRLQGLTVEAITLEDKANGRRWVKGDLEAPPPK